MHIVNTEMTRRLVEDMAENDISFKRYIAALDSLKENDGFVICLQLKNCQINDERFVELFLAMEHSETVTSIDLSDNLITDDGVLFLSKLLRGGGIQSLIYLDVRGNLITSRTYKLLDEIQHVRKILKISYDSDISSEGLSGLDEDVGTERAINYRSRWSAACTDNGDNWLLSKSRICDQSEFKLKDKVQSAIGVLKFKGTLDALRLATMLKEISVLVSNELSLERQNDISSPAQIEYSEGIKSLVDNFQFFISTLDLNYSQEDIRGRGAGLHRIALAELLNVVISHCGALVEDTILSSGILTKMLKLFCDFPQNSILHCAVFRCLQAILSGSSTTVFWHLLKDACLPSFLAREGTKCSSLPQGRRSSFSGHIFALSRTLKGLEENNERLKAFLVENMEWQLYVVQDGPFQKMQAEQSGDLCGPKPVLPRLVANFLQNPTRNLVQLPLGDRVSDDGEAFAEQLHQLQENVRQKLQDNNERYKASTDSTQRYQVFNAGDLVMVYLRKERFSTRTYHKLKYKKIAPCKILKKINDNAYEVELPSGLDISPVFNISDLYTFHGDDTSVEKEHEVDWTHTIPIKKRERVAQILDKKTVQTCQGDYNRYLVQWEELAPKDNTWIAEWELQKLDEPKRKQFEDRHSQELRSFQAGENDARASEGQGC